MHEMAVVQSAWNRRRNEWASAAQKGAEAHHEIVELSLPPRTTVADLRRRIYETNIHGQRVTL